MLTAPAVPTVSARAAADSARIAPSERAGNSSGNDRGERISSFLD